jgi:ERCC4-type nuclease
LRAIISLSNIELARFLAASINEIVLCLRVEIEIANREAKCVGGKEKQFDLVRQKSLETFLPKEKSMELIRIIVDYRERPSQTVSELCRLGAALEFKTLKVGDYVVADEVAIERKTFDDFATSILDRRLFEQARALRDAYSRPLLLLEGRGPLKRGISEEALRGAIVSVVLDLGIPLLWAEDAYEAAKLLMTIARREQRDSSRSISLKDRRRPVTADEEKEYIVASLPMVEAATAKKLLIALKSVQAVFSASEKELMEVDGIGPKKARRIREVIGKDYIVRPSSSESSRGSRRETRGS